MAVSFRSLFSALFHPRETQAVNQHFQFINGYTPAFSTWQGGIYEAELVRSAVDTGARAASKLQIQPTGVAKRRSIRALQTRPNPQQTPAQFLARVWTIAELDDTCYIVPVIDGDEITAFLPVCPEQVRPYEYRGRVWYQVQAATGEYIYIEGSRVGVIMRHQYRNDFRGDGGDRALRPTLDLMHAQEQAEQAAIKQGASVRFLGRIAQALKPSDVDRKRDQFNRNLAAENGGGIAVYDASFADVEQITPHSYTVDAAQMQRIEKSVQRYFGTCERLITSDYDEDTANAFYENRVEPFAIQLAEVLTGMIYTPYEISCGNGIRVLSNRLAYASHRTRLAIGRDLFNQGILSGNEVRELFGMPPYDGGERHIIRGEYIPLELIDAHTLDDARVAAQTNANAQAAQAVDDYDEEGENGEE